MSFISRYAVADSVVSFLRAGFIDRAVELVAEHGWGRDAMFSHELTLAMLASHLPAQTYRDLCRVGICYKESTVVDYIADWMRLAVVGCPERIIVELIGLLSPHALTHPLGRNLMVVASFADAPPVGPDVLQCIRAAENDELHWEEPMVMLRDLGNIVATPSMVNKLFCAKECVSSMLRAILCGRPRCATQLNLRFVAKHAQHCGHDLSWVLEAAPAGWTADLIDVDEHWFPVADRLLADLGRLSASPKRVLDSPPPSPRLGALLRRRCITKIRARRLNEALDEVEEADLFGDAQFCDQLTLELLHGHYSSTAYADVLELGYRLDRQAIADHLGDWLWFRSDANRQCGDWFDESTFIDVLQLVPADTILSVYGCNLLVLATRRAQTTPEAVRLAVEAACGGRFMWADAALMLEDLSDLSLDQTRGSLYCGGERVGETLATLLVDIPCVLTVSNLRYVMLDCLAYMRSLDWFRTWCEKLTPPARFVWTIDEVASREWHETAQRIVEAVRGK